MKRPKKMKKPLMSLKSIDSSKDDKYKPIGIILTNVCKNTGNILKTVSNFTSTFSADFLLFFDLLISSWLALLA